MPKISVVMALYNTPLEYLSKTVESILNQTFKDFELLVVDDASTVIYSDFFTKYADDRIKYIKLENNIGPGGARNFGIKQAQGEYVAVADSDDVYFPERLSVQCEFLDKNREISLLGASFRQSNNGKISKVIESDADIKAFMLFNSPFANPIVMFRKNEFVENNLFYPEDKCFAEDYELWILVMFKGLKMANLKQVLMTYTRRSGQLSKEKADIQKEVLRSLYSKILVNIGINATVQELELHSMIYEENFSKLKIKDISSWFDKIISQNRPCNLFSEEALFQLKSEKVESFKKIKNRLLKIKIGNKNLCLNKNFSISIENRD